MYKNIPVREALASLHVQPSKQDIQGATKEDPENCAYARCLRRTMECANVYVFKTIAYVQTLDQEGKPQFTRYTVKKYAREYILKFDSGQKVQPGGFVFHKPARSITLDYKMKNYRKYSHPRTGKKATPPLRMGLRSGKGRVHFLHNQEIVPRKLEDQVSP
jgi:hypothetical protein